MKLEPVQVGWALAEQRMKPCSKERYGLQTDPRPPGGGALLWQCGTQKLDHAEADSDRGGAG